jgi:4-diphosphocytidyl-2-C-methyl-D-erythritol kinase
VTLTKGIPVAAGLGGGSADAAAALLRGNALLPSPLPADRLHELARELGADVPFFLEPGPKLAEGVGELLSPLELPQDYAVLLARDVRALKPSTGEIYRRFDAQGGGAAFERRRDELRAALREVRRARDLALLPPNDLRDVSGAGGLVARLVELGAFRADVSGAGPTVYGLFGTRRAAQSAARALGRGVHATVTVPVW